MVQPTLQDQQALLEAMRRRSGQLPSSAGIPGGAPVANAITPANPIAQAGMTPPPPPVGGGDQGNPSADGISAVKRAPAGEAQIIISALKDRLKSLTESGQ